VTDDLASLDATAQADLVRRGEVTPLELVEGAIVRIEKLNVELNAVIHPLFDKARDQASSELPNGPFRGVPFLTKDIFCTVAGEPFHDGMRFLKERNWTAKIDSFLAQKFRAAGFISVGKTNVPELGILPTTEPEAYGPTRNPPLGARTLHRWLERWLCSGRGVGHGRHRPWKRRRRVDSHPSQ
jgi:amidase